MQFSSKNKLIDKAKVISTRYDENLNSLGEDENKENYQLRYTDSYKKLVRGKIKEECASFECFFIESF